MGHLIPCMHTDHQPGTPGVVGTLLIGVLGKYISSSKERVWVRGLYGCVYMDGTLDILFTTTLSMESITTHSE